MEQDATRTSLQTLMLEAFRRDYGIDTHGADGLSGADLDSWLWDTETAWIQGQLGELRSMRQGGSCAST